MTQKLLQMFLLLLMSSVALAQDPHGELAKVKERELEDVRARISALKQRMDDNAKDRDRLAGELQNIEVEIAELRMRITEIDRQQRYTRNKKQGLDADVAGREAELDAETKVLAVQVRAAYMSGSQEKIKLLLNQRDPATFGRLVTYYRYLSEYRAGNIAAVLEQIRALEALRSQIAAEEARLSALEKNRYLELGRLNNSQESRQSLLLSLRNKMADDGQEVGRLAAQEKDLSRLIDELTSILSDYPISSERPFSEHKGKLTWPVAGTLLHDFGQPRAGGSIKWNGVVSQRRAVAKYGWFITAVLHSQIGWPVWACWSSLITARVS